MYRIVKNNCNCHPETCSCSSYNILRGNKIIARGNDFKELLELLPVGDVSEISVRDPLSEVITDGICFICKKPTANLSPNPDNWRIDLPFKGGNGLKRQYHQGCLVSLIDRHFA